MSVLFEKSNTKLNLMKAFAGESQAINRYTFSASQAKKEGLAVVERIFTYTANQEREHAKQFYNRLKPFGGQSIKIEADFPVDIYSSTLDLLKAAKNNEYGEYNDAYRNFALEARSEGFEEIAELFNSIADIEKAHGDRFENVAKLIESGELFASNKEERWVCLNCGHIYTSKEALRLCTVCDHNQGYQIRESWLAI